MNSYIFSKILNLKRFKLVLMRLTLNCPARHPSCTWLAFLHFGVFPDAAGRPSRVSLAWLIKLFQQLEDITS